VRSTYKETPEDSGIGDADKLPGWIRDTPNGVFRASAFTLSPFFRTFSCFIEAKPVSSFMAPSRKTMPSIPLFTFILYALALSLMLMELTLVLVDQFILILMVIFYLRLSAIPNAKSIMR
jgi:hypothetical protein